MGAVVFMRGVNVGGHKTFRPAALAKEFSGFDVVSIGAAGTFIVNSSISQAELRDEFLRRLPFEAEFMICRGREIIDLVSADPYPRTSTVKSARRFVSVLARRARTVPRFPISRPAGRVWQVKVVGLRGKFALSVWRRAGKTMVYPNEVVEKELGIAATTRNWDTICRLCRLLEGG